MIKLLLFLGLIKAAFAAPAQVVIVRHAEKDSEIAQQKGLTTPGFERAGALAYYLTMTEEVLKFGLPVAVFGAKKSNAKYDNSVRIVQTATPTAALLKLPINIDYAETEPDKLAQYVLSNRKYDGKNILIFWHYEGIPCLIDALGFKPSGCCDRFDLVYLLTFPADPNKEVSRSTQNLMYGDDPELSPYGKYNYPCPSLKCGK